SNEQRTQQVLDGFEGKMRQLPGVESVLSINGFDVLSGTAAPNGGLMIVKLKPWGERGKDESAAALIAEANKMAFMVPQAISFAFGPPALPGFGASSGFSMLIQAKGSQTSEDLARMTQAFVAEAGKNPAIGRVTSVFSASTPSYELTVDREKAKSLGVSLADISTTLQVALGSLEVNDFSRYGRNYRVILQADAPYREDIGAIDYLKVRNSLGQMVPLNTLVTVKPSHGPRFTTRYNLYKSAELTGAPAPGYSSGQALAALEATAAKVLTPDYGYAWSGQTLEEVETGNSAIIVMALSVVVVFLFLAALYESWSIPIAVLLGVPFGVLGAYLFLLMRGLDFNVYGQIGVVTLVGLSAKNAILIVEFAKLYREQGKPIVEAAIEAARLRLRPILMTSFAFILGIVPLYIASGAGAASKHSVGTVVFGGMLLATSMAVIMVPALYVIVQTLTERWTGRKDVAAPGEGTAPPAANDPAAEGA
ncbi:MAG: efflux RND transporter permease subunit, partial [Sphingomonadales bacterium]|nr:efflux RND transporter permease subunit [Sphingomonadales bacterium]